MSKLRIGLIGAGGNMRLRHLPGFQQIEGVEIVCVANRSRQSGQAVADEYNIPRVHDHWQQVLDDGDVDAICIGTWPYLHAPITCAALAAKKHVLCEARMAMNLDEARQMLIAAQNTDRVAMLVPSPFGLKGDQVVSELLAAGALGEVREIYVRGLAASMLDAGAPLHWRQRADLSGINVLALGILNEAVQRWFGGVQSVMAQTTLFLPRRKDPETGLMQDAEVPDSVAVLARMNSGAQCVYHVSGHAQGAGSMRLEAYGSAGSLTYDLASDEIRVIGTGDDAWQTVPIPAEKAGGWRVEEDFVESIRDGKPVTRTNFRDGIRYMAFTEAVRRSDQTGERVTVTNFA